MKYLKLYEDVNDKPTAKQLMEIYNKAKNQIVDSAVTQIEDVLEKFNIDSYYFKNDETMPVLTEGDRDKKEWIDHIEKDRDGYINGMYFTKEGGEEYIDLNDMPLDTLISCLSCVEDATISEMIDIAKEMDRDNWLKDIYEGNKDDDESGILDLNNFNGDGDILDLYMNDSSYEAVLREMMATYDVQKHIIEKHPDRIPWLIKKSKEKYTDIVIDDDIQEEYSYLFNAGNIDLL